MTGRRALLALALPAAALLGCGEGEPPAVDGLDATPPDAAADAAVDGPPDAAAGPDVGPDAAPPPPARWPDPGPAPAFDHPLAEAHPAAFAPSRWHARFGPPETRRGPSFRGAFAVGDGRVFALAGLADPPTTLHNIAGPTYDRGAGFFGDQAVSLADGPFETAWIAQSLSAPIVMHRGCRGPVCLDVIDLAHDGCLLRHLRVHGGAATVRLTLRPDAEPVEGEPARVERRGPRALVTRLPGGVDDGDGLSRAMADGEQALASACAAVDGLHPGPGEIEVGAVLDGLAFADDGVTVELPDPMVADFIAGVARNLRVQTSATGAASPMHRYTRLWLRDSVGPMLAWLDLGQPARAAALLDALDAEIRRAGDLRNSMPADGDPASAPPAPDYGALPPLSGRTGAEGPGYLAWMHWLYWRHTGEIERARAALPLLRRALLAQDFGPGDRLPFSGDETFRIALNLALDLPLEHAHEDRSWSANSLVLWLGLAPKLAELARAADDAPLAEAIEARLPAVEAAAAGFWREDGCLGALIDRETDALSAPFEDVSLKPTWTGWLAPDDPRARANVDCLVGRLGRAPGVIQSPLAPAYGGLPLLAGGRGTGLFTGMQPAYVLAALTAVDHPHAPHAFAALGEALLPDGMPQEYQVRGDDGPFGLTLLYDAGGRDADQTPKLRPWEAGIALHAVVEHLLGFAPDAPNGRVMLAPRLPPGWDGMAWRGLRVGATRLDVRVEPGAVELVADGMLDAIVHGTSARLRPGVAETFDLPGRE